MLRVQVFLGIFAATILLQVTTVQGWCNETWGCTGANYKCEIYQPCKRGSQCVCKEGYKTNGTDCILSNKNIGDSCTGSFECMVDGSSCSSGKCVCPFNHTISGTTCLKNALGAACYYYGDSCGAFATCNSNNICQCPEGFRPAGDGTNCTHYQPGDVCSIDDCDSSGCGGGSCTSGTYQCLPGLKWYVSARIDQLVNGKCVADAAQIDVGLGYYCGLSNYQYCTANADCESCPEDPNTSRCISLTGSSSAISSSCLYIFITVLVVKYFTWLRY